MSSLEHFYKSKSLLLLNSIREMREYQEFSKTPKKNKKIIQKQQNYNL